MEEAAGLDDLQRFFMILQGDGGKARLGVVGKKRLPSVEKKEVGPRVGRGQAAGGGVGCRAHR